jgi:hypothetical protein
MMRGVWSEIDFVGRLWCAGAPCAAVILTVYHSNRKGDVSLFLRLTVTVNQSILHGMVWYGGTMVVWWYKNNLKEYHRGAFSLELGVAVPL